MIQIGSSSSEISLEQNVHVAGNPIPRKNFFTDKMPLADFIAHPIGNQVFEANVLQLMIGLSLTGAIPKELLEGLHEDMRYQDILDHIAFMTGREANFSHLLMQPVSMLSIFVPKLKEDGLADILNKMNGGGIV